jgi:hypothetical protein
MAILKGLHGSTGFLGLTHRGSRGIVCTSDEERTVTKTKKLIWMPEEKPPVPTVLEVTKFMTSTAKRKRKLMFNSTPIVKGLYVSVN